MKVEEALGQQPISPESSVISEKEVTIQLQSREK